MASIKGSAPIRTRPIEVVIDLRGQPEPSTGRGRIEAIGASPRDGLWARSIHRIQPVTDRILAAWFGAPALSMRGELGATPVSGRACGGNSPTMSSDRPSPGWGS